MRADELNAPSEAPTQVASGTYWIKSVENKAEQVANLKHRTRGKVNRDYPKTIRRIMK